MATKTTSDRFLDANEELVAKSIPIKSYEKQALVPIEEATKTLKRLVNNLDKMVQMAKKNFDQLTNLTQDEAVAIHLYTIKSKKSDTSLSIQLNRALRSGVSKQTDPWSSYIKLFLSALCKLTPFEGKIYRGCQGNISDQYQQDCTWLGFSSCTTSKDVLKKFLGGSSERTIFEIECNNGISISNYSDCPDENEVLLMPGTRLILKNKLEPENGVYVIQMQEEPSKNALLPFPIGTSSSTVKKPSMSQDSTTNTIRSATQMRPAKLDKKPWLDCQYHVGDKQSIMTPENLQTIMNDPPVDVDDAILDRVQGSMVGMALGDALGAHVEFRPRQYLIEHPVRDLVAGGTWGLKKGQVI
ncbi:unnamed protein product [Rotaria sp. Silwood1]|nr:unnamed protein product [Rotaria sp. Silwood1]